MPFKPGKEKTGGRVAGTKNKLTIGIEMRVQEICEEVGVNPFEVLARLALDPDPSVASSAAKALCKYVKPELKAIEISGNADKPLNTSLEIIRKELEAEANERKQSKS